MAEENSASTTNGAPPETIGELRLGVAARGDLRWAVADVSGPLEDARRRLDLSPVAAVALGRGLAAATLVLRFTTKNAGRLVLEARGDGPLGKILAEADHRGGLRGLVGNSKIATPDDGSMAIGSALGKGILRITRESDRGRYSSQVELETGELARDLVHFLEQSQQIRSAALLGVLPRPTGIAAAGGLLIEAFPGTPDETIAQLEENIAALGGVSAVLADGGIAALRDAVLAGFDRDELELHPLAYRCGCDRDRLRAQLRRMSPENLEVLLDASDRCDAECAFCGEIYSFTRQELAAVH